MPRTNRHFVSRLVSQITHRCLEGDWSDTSGSCMRIHVCYWKSFARNYS